MNRKSKLIKTGLIISLILMQQISFGQAFQFNKPYFNITLPSLSEWNHNPPAAPFYYSLFIETGNGRYIKKDSLYGAYTNPPYVVWYNNGLPGLATPSNTGAILNIVGHYDTIKPPKGLLAIPSISNGIDQIPAQNNLPSNKRIRFDYSDSSIIIGDTMTLVVTYKPDTMLNYVVAFFYNEKNTTGKPFNVINNKDLSYQFEGTTPGHTVSTKAIRTWGQEDIIFNPDQFPLHVKSTLSADVSNFDNAIYFTIPHNIQLEEKNIFLSMVTPKKPMLLGALINIKARIVGYNKFSVPVNEPVPLSLPIGLLSSDPNNITTTPHCLNKSPGGNPYNKPVQYDINFQNIGSGPAKNVEVEVFIPDGMQLPSKGFDVTCTVKGKKIKFAQEDANPETVIKKPYTYRINSAAAQRSIIFKFNGIYLPGKSVDFLNSNGSIHFTLNTISKKAAVIKDLTDCMYSSVKITFTSIIGGIEHENPAIGAEDVVSPRCQYTTPTPALCPKRLPEAVFPQKTQ